MALKVTATWLVFARPGWGTRRSEKERLSAVSSSAKMAWSADNSSNASCVSRCSSLGSGAARFLVCCCFFFPMTRDFLCFKITSNSRAVSFESIHA